MTMEDLEFSFSDPNSNSLTQSEALISKLKTLAMSRRMRRPSLEAWSFRIETDLHNELKRLAEENHPLSMTDIVHGLLEVMVPLLRVDRKPDAPALDLANLDPDKRQQLAGLLNSLSNILGNGGRR